MLNKLKVYKKKAKSDHKVRNEEESNDYSFHKYFTEWRDKMEIYLNQNITMTITSKDDSDSIINKIKEREVCCELFNECPNEELLSIFSYLKEIQNASEFNTPYNTEEEDKQIKEQPSEAMKLIDELLSQIKYYQKRLYNPIHKRSIIVITNQIAVDLFMIYLIIKQYPFAIYPRDQIEHYLASFLPFKKYYYNLLLIAIYSH